MSRNLPNSNISLNVHLTVPTASVMTTDGGHTPNTPEILNSIVNMQSGPFAEYQETIEPASSGGQVITPSAPSDQSSLGEYSNPGPVSVQQYTSQFIKDGLRLKLAKQLGSSTRPEVLQAISPEEPQRLLSPMDVASSPGSSLSLSDIKMEELTEEDMLRRMRRRERNKVAATKCRNKKKQKTQLLVKESEVLVNQNQSLKSDIDKLEREKRHLLEILSVHESTCHKRMRTTAPPPVVVQPQVDMIGQLQLASGSATYYSHTQKDDAAFYAETFGDPSSTLPNIKVEDFSSHTEEDFLRPAAAYNYYEPQTYPPLHGHYFLGVKTLGHTYLDLDSRCLAL